MPKIVPVDWRMLEAVFVQAGTVQTATASGVGNKTRNS